MLRRPLALSALAGCLLLLISGLLQPATAAAATTPTVVGYAQPQWRVSYWVPQVTDADICLHPSLAFGDYPCFGYVQLKTILTGLPPGQKGAGEVSLHFSESFVCADFNGTNDPRPSRRTTLHGDGHTEDIFLSRTLHWHADARGVAQWAGPKFYLHSPNNNSYPAGVTLRCGPNQAVKRSAIVLSQLRYQFDELEPDGVSSHLLGQPVDVPGTYVIAGYQLIRGRAIPGGRPGSCCS